MPNTKTAEEMKNLGNESFKQGLFQEALNCYNQAIMLDPALEVAWLNKGICHKKLNDMENAISAFNQVLLLNSTYKKALDNLADCYFQQRNYQQAYHYIELSLAINDNDSIILELREKILDKIGAKIFFGIVDLKLKADDTVKLLEIGCGMESGFRGYCFLNNQTSITKPLSAELAVFNKPLFFGTEPGNPLMVDDGKLLAFLEKEPVFDIKNKNFDPTNIDSYLAIYGSSKLCAVPANILTMDEMTHLNIACGDKIIFHKLFDNSIQRYRPTTAFYPKKYHKNMVSQITKTFTSEKIVLKNPDMQRGEGVYVVENKHIVLQTVLAYFIGNETDQAEATLAYSTYYKNKEGLSLEKITKKIQCIVDKSNIWGNSNSPLFFIESYESSKTIIHNNAKYDGTMRVAFLLIRNQGKIEAKPFACYWKLPSNPMNKGEINAYSVSHLADAGNNVQQVSREEQKTVYGVLKKVLPILFQNSIQQPFKNTINHYQTNKDEYYQKFGTYLLTRLGNYYSLSAKYKLAEDTLQLAKEASPSSYKVHHELGLLYSCWKKYAEAIKCFDHAISIEKQPATFYRRGKAYEAMGKYELALNDLKTAKQLSRQNDLRYDIGIMQLEQLLSHANASNILFAQPGHSTSNSSTQLPIRILKP